MEVDKIEKQRNYSLDLLRIVAIIMIIIFHVCYKGLIFENLSGFNKIIVAFLLHLSWLFSYTLVKLVLIYLC